MFNFGFVLGSFFFTWMSGCSTVVVLPTNANLYIWFLLVVVAICICFFKFLLDWFCWMLLKMWLKVYFFIGSNLTLKIVLFYIVIIEIAFGIWFALVCGNVSVKVIIFLLSLNLKFNCTRNSSAQFFFSKMSRLYWPSRH